MMRNQRLSRTQSANLGRGPRAGGWFSRWPWAWLLLALAFSLGVVGPAASAQAAPADDYSKKIYMLVTKAGSAERTVCVGDKVDVRARVVKIVQDLTVTSATNGGCSSRVYMGFRSTRRWLTQALGPFHPRPT